MARGWKSERGKGWTSSHQSRGWLELNFMGETLGSREHIPWNYPIWVREPGYFYSYFRELLVMGCAQRFLISWHFWLATHASSRAMLCGLEKIRPLHRDAITGWWTSAWANWKGPGMWLEHSWPLTCGSIKSSHPPSLQRIQQISFSPLTKLSYIMSIHPSVFHLLTLNGHIMTSFLYYRWYH